MDMQKKKVLVTGADGFIGSHLVETLIEAGCKVRAFVYYNAFNSWGWLDTIDRKTLSKIDVFTGDIRDPNGVRKAVKGMDVIFHLAALIGIPFSYHSPDSYIDTNVKGALNILQAAREMKTRKVLMTSTSEVYGTARSVPMREDHPLRGQSPYSASKIAADKITEAFRRSFGLPVTVVRPFNTYGPRQSARAVIPAIIIQLLDGRKKIALGSLDPKRDFNYVKDVCAGFVSIAEADRTIGEEINIASGKAISIGGLAKIIIKKINPAAELRLDKKRVRPGPSEVMNLLGADDKIKKLTGWKARYDLEEGIGETIEWFRDKNNLKSYKTGLYNV